MAISDLKGIIDATITTNGRQEITGASLNEVLTQIVDATDAQFAELSDRIYEDTYTIRASGESVVNSNGIAQVVYKTSSKTRVSYILNDTSLHTIYGYYAEGGYETLAKELDVSNGSYSIIFTPSKEISRIGFACSNAVGQSIEYAISEPSSQQIESNSQQIESNSQQIVKLSEKSLSYNGGNLKESNVTTYKRVFSDLTLLSGIGIKNNGVAILVAKNAQLEGRIDIKSGEEKTISFDAAYFQTLNVSGDVDIDIIGINKNSFATKDELGGFISEEDLNNFVFSADSIADSSIGIEKLAIASSINLLNLNDKDVAIGKYITVSGQIATNASYNTTGFIPVEPGATYQLLTQKGHDRTARFLVFFDDKKQSLGQILTGIYEVVIPSDARYIRISYYATMWDETLIQVTKGLDRMEAIPYALTIDKKYLPTLTDFKEDNFYLPKHIYVASGRTIELYYEQILINAHKYNIQANCPIGIALERKFQIIGNDSLLGDYELTINVYDDNATLLATAKSTIHIVSADITAKSVVPIGDSLTNGKAWLTEVQTLSNNQVVFVGTRKSGTLRHEGRSGVSPNIYISDKSTYTYDNQYAGVGSSASEFSSSAQYSKGDFCKYNNVVYIFKESHSGAWDATKVRNISQTNPFWNWETDAFSLAHYKSFQGLDFDAIIIFLGTNGISLDPMTKNGALGIKTLVDDIRKEDATTPILVVNTIFRSGQNGIGRQGNTDGYSASSECKFNADRKVMLLAKALDEVLEGVDNVYICPVGFTHDSAYNFGVNKVSVNPRLTDTSEVYEIYPNESIHPQKSGYMQIADEIFSTLCAL